MTKDQARKFFEKKFNIIVGDSLLNELITTFDRFGLIDIRRIIRDAMMLTTDGVFGKNASLLSGNAVMVDRLPASLNKNKNSNLEIDKRFKDKLELRFSNGTPMSTLHRVFHDVTDGNDNRFVTKLGLRNILRKFDIILSDTELDSYYLFHLGDDEKLGTRKIILSLFPSINPDENPFSPKSEAALRYEKMLAEALADFTHTSRKVSMLNGPAFTRLGSHNLISGENIVPRQSSIRKEDIEHYLNIGNYTLEASSDCKTTEKKVTNDEGNTDFKYFDYNHMIKLLQEAKNRELIETIGGNNYPIPKDTADDNKIFHDNSHINENVTHNTDYETRIETNFKPQCRPKSANTRSQVIDSKVNRPLSANNKFPSKVLSSRCYAKSCGVKNVDEKSRHTIKFDNSNHRDVLVDTYAIRSFLQRPNTSGSTSTTAKSPRVKLFANSGQNWVVPVNPVSESLRQKYHYERRGKLLSSHEYGLFVKSLTKAEQYQKKLRKQFEETTRLLTGTGSRVDTPKKPKTTNTNTSSNSPRKINIVSKNT